MSEVEIHDKSWLEIKQENKKLKETIEKMANEIFIEYNPHFISTEAVIEFYMDAEKINYCSASNNDRCTCREEKMGCRRL